MTLQILQKGTQISLDMDQTGFTGDITSDSQLPVVTKMVAGRLVAIGPTGATLADGQSTGTGLEPVGWIINDAAGYFFENKPAFASGKIGVVMGPAMLVSDQIDTTKTFNLGDRLYAGTGAALGLLTNAPGTTGARLLGIAASVASAASPNLTFYAL
jgi:hypothetical protein